MSKSKENKVVEPVVETFEEATPIEETKVEETVLSEHTEKVTVYIGKIRDCDKLNVREKPNADAKVLCKLDKDSEVQIEKAESTKDFYKVYTSSGVSGYCMKKYMSVKKQEV